MKNSKGFILMGNRWDMKYDSQKDILDYAKPSEDNFHSLGRELSDKVIPDKDPLYSRDDRGNNLNKKASHPHGKGTGAAS